MTSSLVLKHNRAPLTSLINIFLKTQLTLRVRGEVTSTGGVQELLLARDSGVQSPENRISE